MAQKVRTEAQKVVLSLVLLAFVFACMGVFARYLGHGFTIFQQVYLRIFVALICSLFIFRHRLDLTKLKKATQKEWLVLVARGVLLYGIAVPMLSQAVIDTKLGNVSFLNTLPFIAIFGFIFFKEKVTTTKILLILLAMVGVGLITIRDPHHLSHLGKGEVLAIISGAMFSLSYVARKWHTKLFNNQEITVLVFVFGVSSAFLFSLLHKDGMPRHWTWGLVGVVVVAGLANVINLFLTNYGFERVKNVLAGNVLTLEVFFAIVIGYLLYGETLGPRELLGGLLIVASVVMMNKYTAIEQ